MSTKIKSKVNINVSEDVIDIPGNKLLEWLLDRKKIAQHWKRSQSSLLQLINDACEQTLKEKNFEQLPGGNTKTLFGNYSNPNTQKWYEVIKTYEKDYYHIAESCQIFTNNLNYEIPALKKTIEKSIKVLEEDSKKSYEKTKNTSINTFKKACSDLGITGEKIREEILELPFQLNSIFDEISKQLLNNEQIKSAIEYYKDILNLTNVVLEEKDNPLPLLSFLIKYGNITMIERETILNPNKQIENNKNNKNNNNDDKNNSNNNNNNNIEIDWCMDIKSEENSDQPNIVWEDNLEPLTESNSQAIQWGDDFSMNTIEIVEESSNDFEITLEESSNDQFKIESNNETNNKKEEKQEKEKKEIQESYDPNETILSYRPLRNQFLDELYQLDIFLNNRINEIEKSSSSVFDQILNEDSVTSAQCKEYSNILNQILNKLTNNRVRQILEIKSSKKFIDRLVVQFTQKQQAISKNNQSIKDNEEKIENLNLILGESKNKIDLLNKETRILKSNLEQLISNNLFEKKKINLMIPYNLN
ncbi:hypothetical protein DICPUDRAFT_153855 [Dictyostelium purpureum]|uniref:DUF733 family protein n=1 Tax=Dictyostelium purpureum TaxID=5786 RepID=F0ZPW9_DICPU|nr:uncharacterized protein DICPUDRAFT_153855 [Dictyostelium purpureum]EGC34022.1 hypothetical protein DICPUDRAFT_153855 [Dictyostelium purpureum]|eukprot:XP_003289466.1 hypothetical protein DICPUDRAFT_153855 [Dictyostelium purpureum]